MGIFKIIIIYIYIFFGKKYICKYIIINHYLKINNFLIFRYKNFIHSIYINIQYVNVLFIYLITNLKL